MMISGNSRAKLFHNKKADLEKYRSRLQRFFIQTSENAPQSIFYIQVIIFL